MTAAGEQSGTPSRRRLGVAAFWVSSLSVGLAAFVVLAVLARTGAPGELAAASAVIGVSFVIAVVPGAIQLRGAASAAAGDPHTRLPARFVGISTAVLLIASWPVAEALGVPAPALALLAPQYAAACLASAQRGRAVGLADHRRASESMASEAAIRIIAGVGLGATLGATGLALSLVLGSAGAALLGRRWAGPALPMPAGGLVAPAAGVGALMLLVNLDAFLAPRLLGATGADGYAAAELPARGVFFALFALSWLSVPAAARAARRAQLMVPLAGVLGLGAAAGLTLLLVRPLLPIALGDPAPPADLLATLVAAMTLAAALATALAMAVARDVGAPWWPTLLAAAVLAAALLAVPPTPERTAALVLAATGASLLATTLLVLRSLPGRRLAPAPPPLLARR
jgi:hypothetical protein